MKFHTFRAVCCVGVALAAIVACNPRSQGTVEESNEQAQFFQALQSQCGATYTGSTEFASSQDPNDPFVSNPLKIHIRDCSEQQIRIPFYVGADSSRTWILTLNEAGLELKHDHRLADGSLDSLTNYGGMADTNGTSLSQTFPADAFTAQLIPEASTNKWTISLDPQSGTLEYKLERHGQPRYHARFHKDP